MGLIYSGISFKKVGKYCNNFKYKIQTLNKFKKKISDWFLIHFFIKDLDTSFELFRIICIETIKVPIKNNNLPEIEAIYSILKQYAHFH